MKCVLSFDGLNLEGFQDLEARLPRCKAKLQKFKALKLDANPFAAAQSNWAAFLTASCWDINGCYGYAKVNGSLNKLIVCDEGSFAIPCVIPDENCISFNIPLLKPKKRIWAADGSLPTTKLISPSHLRALDICKNYKPRVFRTVVQVGAPHSSAMEMIECEVQKLKLANFLIDTEPHKIALIRFNLFDDLTHIFGVNYLKCFDLGIANQLDMFLSSLDQFLSKILDLYDSVIFASFFSHDRCTAGLNLNSLLAAGGFTYFNTERNSDNDKLRWNATTALSKTQLSTSLLSSMNGQLDLTRSTAASPVAGCVFINSSKNFIDGTVDAENYHSVRATAKKYLATSLRSQFGDAVLLQENPSIEPVSDMPEFIVRIKGVELHNMFDQSQRSVDIPRTTHSPIGFVKFSGSSPWPNSITPSPVDTITPALLHSIA